MKFEVTASFRGDWKRLSDHEWQLFRDLLPRFNEACDVIASGAASAFPASLRVRVVENAPGIFELTWSFGGPDGRATFEWVTNQGARGVRWRRIGGHRIFGQP